MSQYVFDSLEIKNFRAFDHLRIPKLGRVNLLTGKNNVGKSSVLEALELYASNGAPATVRALLSRRGQYTYPRVRLYGTGQQEPPGVESENLQNIRYLFHDATTIFDHLGSITIGPAEDEAKTFAFTLDWFVAERTNATNDPRFSVSSPPGLLPGAEKPFPYVTAGFPEQLTRTPLVGMFPPVGEEPLAGPAPINCQSVNASGYNAEGIAKLWDRIQLTEREGIVISALKIVLPRVERVSLKLTGEPLSLGYVITKLSGSEDVVPLKMLGDGINRLFGLILSLVNAANGVFLIDEVENGLHYSVMPDVWRLIFTVAKQLNIQVFATTHSYDCIEAFQEAAQENKNEGALIRIENRNGRMITTEFDDRRLEIATKQLIEVR